MTTGPRPQPYPIILHVDDNGNPVRLAEASAVYITSAVIGTLSATNYRGINLGNPGFPAGGDTEVQFRKSATELDADSSFKFDKINSRLIVSEIVVGNFSGTGDIFFEEVVVANEVSSNSTSSINSTINTLSSTTISAVTVCAVNYNSLFDSLSFQNLDNRYLNSSGDSVTGSFYLENLSSVAISATSYRNLPSALATWNASAIQGFSVTSTTPLPGQALVYFDGKWQPSSVAGGAGGAAGGPANSIQFNNGVFSGVDAIKYAASISGIQSVGLSSTNLSSINISVGTISATTYNNLGEDTSKWNAGKIRDIVVLKPSNRSYKDILAINSEGTQYEKASIDQYGQWVYQEIKSTIHSELPATNASAIRGVTVTATTPVTNNVLIYNGSVWTPSSAVSLATVSATNYRNLPTSSLSGLADVSANTVSGGQALIYSSSVNKWAPGYRIYQNNLQPNSTLGANGDIYFQILDSTGIALSSLTDTSIVNPSNGQTLVWNSSISRWQAGAAINSVGNASAIRGEPILAKESANATTTLGALFHIYSQNSYQTVPFNSSSINGTRNFNSLFVADPPQGAIVGSYLGSASEYFQINPYWNSPDLTGIFQQVGVTSTYEYPDLPQDKDVLVFTENLYNKQLLPPLGYDVQDKAWTWERLSLVGGYLLDVNVEDPALNQVLTYNGSQWVNSSNITQVSATGFYAASAELSSVKLTKYYESRTEPTITASALTLNLNNSQIFNITLNSNISSITIQNTANVDNTAQGFTLAITYGATARTISWPASIKWPGGSAPVLTNSNSKTDIFSFVTLNKGSSWLGFISGQNYSA
jgi:hypothetical protein